jgi:NAD(P)-dependent dehydrogenase (short-subunit alcohol dehydrogenase family)
MTNDLFDIAGRVIVVTGASGKLGRAYAKALLRAGALVGGIDLSGEAPIAPDHGFGGGYVHLQADVTDSASLHAALRRLESHFGRPPRGLINNAALDAPPDAPAEENGPFETYPKASFTKVMEVNVAGSMMACQVFGGRMAETEGGSIINICSTYGLVSPDQRLYEFRRHGGEAFHKPVSYAASKSAILNLTRYLATYWAGKNVRVNTLTPGGVFDNQDKRFLGEYERRTPLVRMARETEFDGAIIFLLSDATSYMTGANLVMDGGWTAW